MQSINKEKRRNKLLLGISALIILTLLLIMNNGLIETLPDGLSFFKSANTSSLLTQSDLNLIREKIETPVEGYSQSSTVVKNLAGNGTQVVARFGDTISLKNSGIKMISANFDKYGWQDTAVLEQSTAESIFGTVDCIDLPVLVNGKQYLVVGVYKEQRHIFTTLAGKPTTIYLTDDIDRLLDIVLLDGFKANDSVLFSLLPQQQANTLSGYINVRFKDDCMFFMAWWIAYMFLVLVILLFWFIKSLKRTILNFPAAEGWRKVFLLINPTILFIAFSGILLLLPIVFPEFPSWMPPQEEIFSVAKYLKLIQQRLITVGLADAALSAPFRQALLHILFNGALTIAAIVLILFGTSAILNEKNRNINMVIQT